MRQFILYCICGFTGVTTDYIIYYLCVQSGIWYQTANIAGYLAGTLVSFVLNRAFTFNVKDKVVQRLAVFIGVAMIGFSLSALMLYVLVDHLALDSKIAKLLTLPVVVLTQFSLNRWITFASNGDVPAKINS